MVLVDDDGGETTAVPAVLVQNVDPTADITSDGPVGEGEPLTVTFVNIYDPSSRDRLSLMYRYDWNDDGDYEDINEHPGLDSSRTHIYVEPVPGGVCAELKDDDGNWVSAGCAPSQPTGDLDVKKSDGTLLDDNLELSPGGYVPLNNDDDDYDSFPDLQNVQVIGETDLVPLVLHPVNPATAGGKYHLLTVSGKISIYKNADKTGVVNLHTEFDPTQETTVYVGGTIKSDRAAGESVTLLWIKDDVVAELDQVRLTVYEVTGATNVPGYSRHTYAADVPGGTGGTWSATGGTAETCYAIGGLSCAFIHWGEGPVVGKAIFSPAAGFQVEREVNVVQIKLKAGATNAIAYGNRPGQNAVDGRYIVAHGEEVQPGVGVPGIAMDGKLTIETIAGPVVAGAMRGVKFMEMGFIQEAKLTRQHGNYDDASPPKRRISSAVDGVYHPDVHETSTWPWLNSANVRVRSFMKPLADGPVTDRAFEMRDTPQIPGTDSWLLPDDAGDQVDSFEIEDDFRVYFAARTVQAVNGSDQIYTIRATAAWEFNGSGTIDAGLKWAGVGAGNTGSGSFAEVTNGDSVAIVAGPTANQHARTATWRTENQP